MDFGLYFWILDRKRPLPETLAVSLRRQVNITDKLKITSVSSTMHMDLGLISLDHVLLQLSKRMPSSSIYHVILQIRNVKRDRVNMLPGGL